MLNEINIYNVVLSSFSFTKAVRFNACTHSSLSSFPLSPKNNTYFLLFSRCNMFFWKLLLSFPLILRHIYIYTTNLAKNIINVVIIKLKI